jgi:hypothetical protein
MAFTYSKLAEVTVGATSVSNISFTNIPQNYTDLKLVASIRTTRTGSTQDAVALNINGSGTNLSARLLQANGSSPSSNTQAIYFGYVDTASNTANTFGNLEIYFPNYSNTTTFKSYSADSVEENNATSTFMAIAAGLNSNVSPIYSISIQDSGGSYVQYSTATLYGVKAEV